MITFIMLVYTAVMVGAGFMLGAKYKTFDALKARFKQWLKDLLSRGDKTP